MDDPAKCGDALLLQELTWARDLARRLLTDDSQIDDVVHEAWVAARLQPQASIRTNFRSWLATVVQNRVRRIIRTERRRTRREQAVARAPIVDSTIEVVERGALLRELTTAVMALDEPYRSAILLRFLDGLRGEQVAARQGVSHDAARKRISRGLQMLRERLGRDRVAGLAAWSAAWSALADGAPRTPPAAGRAAPWMTAFAVAAVATVALGAWWMVRTGPAAEPSRAAGGVVARAADRSTHDVPGLPTADRRSAVAGGEYLQIVDDSGSPRPGVTVLSLSRGALLQRAVSDADGRLPMPSPGADEVAFASPGVVPCVVPVRAARAEARFVVPTNARVAGTIALPPGRSTHLLLLHDRVADWAERFAPAVLAELAALGIAPDRVVVPLRDAGTFSISGLSPTWSGRLVLGDGWTLRGPRGVERAGTGSSVMLLRPIGDLRITATPPALVVGRLTQAGVPVVGLAVHARWRSSFGTAPSSCCSDEHGGFSLGVGRGLADAASEVRLFVGAPGGGASCVRAFTVEAGCERIDLGEIALGPRLTVSVADATGRPLPGASVSAATPHGINLCVAADDTGTAVVPHLPVDARHVLVRARGHATQVLPLDGSTELRVVLAPGNGLAIAVRARDGGSMHGLSLLVEADAMPFVVAGQDPGAALPDGAFQQAIELDAEARAQLSDLVPGQVLRLTVVDVLGHAVAQAEVVAPPPPGIDQVTMVVTRHLHPVEGRARSEHGMPVPDAGVRLEVGGRVVRTTTDADGRFVLGAALDEPTRARLVVQHPVFAPYVDAAAAFGTPASPLDVVLRPSRIVRVRVVQPGGGRAEGCGVEADCDGCERQFAVEREGGVHVFDRLPFTNGTTTAVIGGHRFSATLGAAQDDVELRVPALGGVSLRVADVGAALGTRLQLRIVDRDRPMPAQSYALRPGASGGASAQTIALLPGVYLVQLQRAPGAGSADAESLGDAVTLQVQPGETRELALPAGAHAR